MDQLDPDLRARVTAARVARLATVRPDGRPHLVPVTFAVHGETLVTAIDDKPKRSGALQRLRNIEASPTVSVLIDHYEDDWDGLWWVRADGTASVLAVADAGGALASLVDKYPQYVDTPPAGPVIVVAVRRWSSWTATALRRAGDRAATSFPGAPRTRILAACDSLGRDVVVDRCLALLAGRPVDDRFVTVLGGRHADRLLASGVAPDQRYWLRVWAVRGLLWAWDGRDPAPLRAGVRDETWRVREMTCKVVARHLIGDLVADVASLADDPVERVRVAAGRAVARVVAAGS